eukprot:3100854-Amphidinium_carterae.1
MANHTCCSCKSQGFTLPHTVVSKGFKGTLRSSGEWSEAFAPFAAASGLRLALQQIGCVEHATLVSANPYLGFCCWFASCKASSAPDWRPRHGSSLTFPCIFCTGR